jgi:hypothetical protein
MCIVFDEAFRFLDVGCQSMFKVVFQKESLRIADGLQNFSMEHNHALMKSVPRVYPGNRTRFLPSERRFIYGLLGRFKSPTEVREHVRDLYGLEMTSDDLRRMRRKLRFSENQKSDLERVRNLLREDGVMEVDVDVDMNLCLLSFTSNRLRELFQRYGTVQ